MTRVQTCLLALATGLLTLVILTAGAAGATAADSPPSIDPVYSTEEGNDAAGDDVAEDDDGEGNETSPANLTVTDVETNAPITAGETIDVTLSVENAGDEAGSGAVWFELGDYLKDDTTVSLGPGNSTSVSLSYVSKEGDAADWPLTAGAPDGDDYTKTVTIEERDDEQEESSPGGGSGGFTGSASFDVESFTATDSATVGDEVHLNATVENTGTAGEEKLVWFSVGETTVNRTELELDRGSERTMTHAYDTSDLENGTHEVAVETPDGVETRELRLEPRRSDLRVESVDANATVEVGDHVDVSVELYNAGNATADTDVTLLLDEHHIDTVPVSVMPNESTTTQLTYRTLEELTGDVELVIDADDAREDLTVNVTEPDDDPAAAESTPTPDPLGESLDTPNSTDPVTSTAEDTTNPSETVPGFGVVPMLVAAALALASIVARGRRQ